MSTLRPFIGHQNDQAKNNAPNASKYGFYAHVKSMNFLKQFVLTNLIVFSFFGFLGCGGNDKRFSGGAPEISLPDYQGNTRSFPYEDKVTLLVFWATWCKPCLMEIPSLNSLAQKYEEETFQVVSVNVDDEKGNLVSNVSKSYGITYPVVYGDQEFQNKFGGIVSLPTSFIIGPDGKIKEKIQGLYPEHILESKIQKHMQTS